MSPDRPKRHRLFIALPLGEPMERALGGIMTDLKKSGGAVKYVDPRNCHLTVRFLGDTDEQLIPELKAVLDRAAAKYAAIETTIDRLGAFPNLKRPRVFWAGLARDESVEPLTALAEDIEKGVQALGFEPDNKKFKPHLTLARVKRPDGLRELCDTVRDYRFKVLPLTCDRLVLFKSELTPKGPVYTRLHEARLGEERFE
ncbi:RNA 2',3'-cyclic phosphodiesterase [candidate division GN15 bacterium]|nr:RNA 2',3'-cyclic phosphodiesterase [candidate division GN15 bacterium]